MKTRSSYPYPCQGGPVVPRPFEIAARGLMLIVAIAIMTLVIVFGAPLTGWKRFAA